MRKLTYGSLFSGIGGIDLGLDRAGWECKWQIEVDSFCRKVLEKHWPNVKRYGDIKHVDGRKLEHVELLAGGFPCQDLSQAGRRAGIEGTRSGLWFEFARIIGELRPRYVLIENVPGILVPGAMSRVVGELARLGYVGLWLCLRASGFGASHLRKRVFIVAMDNASGTRQRVYDDYAEFSRRVQFESGESSNQMAHGADDGLGQRSAAYHHNGRDASRYDADGCDTNVDDSQTVGCGNGHAAHLGTPHRDEHPLGDAGADMAHSGSNGCGFGGEAHNGFADWRGEVVAYATSERHNGTGITEAGLGSESANGSGYLAHGIGAELEERSGSGEPHTATCTEPESIRLPCFAPGPNSPLWGEILRIRPDLAPALVHAKRQPIGDVRGRSGNDEEQNGTTGTVRNISRLHLSEPSSGDDSEGGIAPLEPALRRMAPRIPNRIHGAIEAAMQDRTKRLSRLGNSVVPQVAEWIGVRLRQYAEREL